MYVLPLDTLPCAITSAMSFHLTSCHTNRVTTSTYTLKAPAQQSASIKRIRNVPSDEIARWICFLKVNLNKKLRLACKIIDHTICSHARVHLNTMTFFFKHQHGFGKGLFCDTQLAEFTHDLHEIMSSSY